MYKYASDCNMKVSECMAQMTAVVDITEMLEYEASRTSLIEKE
jgi:hypothetical protein